ncbi:competence protein ComEA [Kineococcus xinjiangensis]|uniref:Competence protein ComEA n=2 Tax=Kineococcus xinjiangensis TaxID=512762 RepID=A0A2S6IIZ4_9ACTN|nr:competence protein ComEA [Kineococcus xinjiangensis]
MARRQLRAAALRREAAGGPDAPDPARPAPPRLQGPPGEAGRARHRAGPPPLQEELLLRVADRLPASVRLLPRRSAALGAVLLTAVAAVLVGARAGVTWPAAQPGPRGTSATALSATGAEAGAGQAGAPDGERQPTALAAVEVPPLEAVAPVVVHVVGRVARPGVVELPGGSRVAQALDAAGGAAPDADLGRLNLARVLVDGEQLHVPAPGEPAPGPPPGGSAAPGVPAAAGGPGQVLDLNTATVHDLDALPGVGPVLAERIVAWRGEHGRFSQVEQLGEVEGIGPKLLAGLRDLVRT